MNKIFKITSNSSNLETQKNKTVLLEKVKFNVCIFIFFLVLDIKIESSHQATFLAHHLFVFLNFEIRSTKLLHCQGWDLMCSSCLSVLEC